MQHRLMNICLLSTVAVIAFSPVGAWLESTMTTHVLLEIPLLVCIGVVLGAQLGSRCESALRYLNAGGISGILLASFTLAFWMIPRWLDTALSEPFVAGMKYTSLIALAGIPLALSWPMAHVITRAVVKIEFLTMLFRLGWLYLISPERLCNNYLLSDQVWLGKGFLVIGLALAVTWLLPVFFGHDSVRDPASVKSVL